MTENINLLRRTHISSNGITLSHLQAVVPYGGSQITQSTLPLAQSTCPLILNNPLYKFHNYLF